MSVTQNPRLLTPRQIADLAGVTEATVRRWLKLGRLDGIKIGRVWRISEASWRKFVEGE